MRVIGIDPGYATTGYAVVERTGGTLRSVEHGVIKTSSSDPQAERLVELHSQLAALIARYEPEAAAVERLFFNVNVKTAMAVGQACGVALLAAGAAGIAVHDYTPLEVKQSVTGVGSASKGQVQTMVAALLTLREPPRPPDAADACALAICHLNRSGLRRRIAAAASRSPVAATRSSEGRAQGGGRE